MSSDADRRTDVHARPAPSPAEAIRAELSLPAVCAPMTAVSGPELVAAACKAGVVGALPPQNAARHEEFRLWMAQISESLKRHADEGPGARVGPLAVNLHTRKSLPELQDDLAVSVAHGVRIFITAMGNPREVAKMVHDAGGLIFHDVTTIRHAEKAIGAGVDGLTCVCAGGGGHSGAMSPLVFVPHVRSIFDGVVIMAGGVSTGRAIRAAEVLGADLAYLGTRFIATRESRADPRYKAMIAELSSGDLAFTSRVSGVAANWLKASLHLQGIDLEGLAASTGAAALQDGVKLWRDVWSCGQGMDLIEDVPSVDELVGRLKDEYHSALAAPGIQAGKGPRP